MEFNFADRMSDLKGSAIREIFKVIAQPDIISFAGGVPSPDTYPVDALNEISQRLLVGNAAAYLNYGVTNGYPPLIEILKERLTKQGVVKDSDEMMITTGGQQGIDLAAKSILNKGDGLVCENPSFIGALNSFRTYEAELFGVTLQNDGLDVDEIKKTIKENKNIKIAYIIPTFQNPGGVTTSLEKRKKILEICKANGIIIIEDNPYGELRFKGEDVPTIKSLDTDGDTVIYVGSLSKVLSPGMRIGFVVANSKIIGKMEILKQVNDVHTNQFAQALAYEWLKNYDFEEHLEKARLLYKHKCELMLKTMDETFPEFVTYTRPEGGLFILCTINKEGIDSAEVVKACIDKKVAFVPGFTFMVDMTKTSNMFRLNYSTMSDEKIVEGIKILAGVLKTL